MSGRLQKSMLNAKVNLLFFFLSLFFAFFSRRVFLNNLGDEFIGLSGTLGNILGYLKLAEMGVGTCICYFLYKPIESKDKQGIQEILSIIGYLYRIIGTVILVAGLIVSLFFPLIFSKTHLGNNIIYFTFYCLLGSSMIGYFINYRQILLAADQKKYLVAIYYQSANLAKTAIQIILAYTYKNLFIWVSVEFIFSILGCIILNWKINKEYPWLRTDKNKGKILLKKYPGILNNTKKIFIHSIKDFLMGKSDELFIFLFVSLKMVAFYGNYMMIIAKVTTLFKSVLAGVNDGVGNLVAEGNKANIMKVFWELTTIRHFIAGLLCFTIYHFIEPFISLWLGKEYILDHTIIIMLTIYIYITNSRGVTDTFNHAHGLYADVWAAWTELGINVSITLIAGYYWGIKGILLGKLVSLLTIVIIWKPYYLFSSGFKLPVKTYWEGASRNFAISIISFIFGTLLLKQVPIQADQGFLSWFIYGIIGVFIYLTINLPLTYLFAKGSKDSLRRIKYFRR